MFSCYVAALCSYGGKRIEVRYVSYAMTDQVD